MGIYLHNNLVKKSGKAHVVLVVPIAIYTLDHTDYTLLVAILKLCVCKFCRLLLTVATVNLIFSVLYQLSVFGMSNQVSMKKTKHIQVNTFICVKQSMATPSIGVAPCQPEVPFPAV